MVQAGDLSEHVGQGLADVRTQRRAGQQRTDRGHGLGPHQVAGGVIQPQVQLRLELVDHRGASLHQVGAVIHKHAQLTYWLVDAVSVQPGGGDRSMGGCRGIDGVGLGAGGSVQLAVGHHEPGRHPDHLLAGEEQTVSKPAGESMPVLDGPGQRCFIADRADPGQQSRDQLRAVLHGQRSADLSAGSIHGNRHVNVLVRVDTHCHHRRCPFLCTTADDGTAVESPDRGTHLLRVDGSASFYQVTSGQGSRPPGRHGHINGRPVGTCSPSHPAAPHQSDSRRRRSGPAILYQ